MQTSTNVPQAQPSLRRSVAVTLRALLLLTLFLCALLPAPRPRANAGQASLPNLQGAAASDYLKQQGLHASLGEAMAAARYGMYEAPVKDQPSYRYYANNPAQQMLARFAPEGMSLHAASSAQQPWRLGMKLHSAGYGKRQIAVAPGTLSASGNRIEIARTVQSPGSNLNSQIIEWYVNRAKGLEQGFTLAQPLGKRRAGEPLRLVLQIEGGWQTRSVEEGRAITLRHNQRGETLRYDKLVVQDATGRELPARMQTQGSEFWLEVDEAGAVYPVTIDPTFSQQQKLTAGDAATDDRFGFAVGISGETIVVGAPTDSNAAGSEQGSAYVFTRIGEAWTQQQKLTAGDAAAGDQFGWSVGISGETIVIGARQDNVFQGSAYVFVHTGTTWTQQQKLEADDAAVDDQFGFTVGVSGETIVVGALGDNGAAGENQGSAYVFVREGTIWTQQQKLIAGDPAGTSDLFGYAVGINGDTIIVGVLLDDDTAGTDQGSAYVFVREGTVWTRQQKLLPNDAAPEDHFGYAVGISGGTIIVSAVNTGKAVPGRAYVFIRVGANWTQQQKLSASDPSPDDQFGYAVGISGETIVVGSPFDDDASALNHGSAYIFGRNGANWTQYDKIEANDGATNDFFGYSVGISGETVVIGAALDDDTAGIDQGGAFVFNDVQPNVPPTITIINVSRQIGSPATNSQIAAVNDTEDPKDILQVQISSGGTSFSNTATLNGVTVTLTDGDAGATGVNPNAAGQVFADVVAACGANNATFTLKVTDSGGLMTTAPLTVTVNVNTPPVLSYNDPAALVFGIGATINPATGPSDNESIASLAVQSKGEFTGNVSINSSGVVTLSNAAPIGTHTITIRATDNCNQTTDATFTVTVSSCTDATLVTFSNLSVNGRMYRYQVTPTSATLDLTFIHPDLQFPHHAIVVPATGELLVSDKGVDASGNLSSFLRFKDPLGAMTYNGKFNTPDMVSSFWLAIRNNELFVPQGVNNMLRFLIGANGSLTPSGIITDGLGNTSARGVVLTPWGELFVTRCCGDDYIVRYKFDANGNAILNGTISGNGLSNPHGMVFSSWGEMFVANFGGHTVSRFTFDANRNASPNGQIIHSSFRNPFDVAFSPWGELFVSNEAAAGITRFVFDGAHHNAAYSGYFETPSTLHGLLFLQPSSVCSLLTPPTVTSLGATSQAGSPAVNAQIGTALDGEDVEDVLQLQISSDGITFGNSATLNGVTVTLTDRNPNAAGTNPDSAGKIFADVVAACEATSASFTFCALDSSGVTGLASLAINVTANTPPVLSYNPAAIVFSASTTVNPATGPSDNGGISSIVVQGVAPSTAPGTITVNNSTGVVSVPNNIPAGAYTVTIRATDNCLTTTDAIFTLTVQAPNLAVSKSNPSPALVVGQNSIYTITVTNNGNAATATATVKEAIPAGLTLTNATGTGWMCSPTTGAGPATVTCTFSGSIAASGGMSTISIGVTPTATGNVINRVSIDPTGGTNAPDPAICTALNQPSAGCGAPVGPSMAFDPGAALDFDGVDDFVSIPNALALNPAAITVEAWVRPMALNAKPQGILHKQNSRSDNYDDYVLAFTPNGAFLGGVTSSAGLAKGITSSPVTLGQWYHVALTADGNTLKLYVNGALVGSTATGFPLDHANTPLLIGKMADNSCCTNFTGEIDEVRIWNYVRSCAEVNFFKGCELTGTESGLAAYYRFNQGSASGINAGATTLIDASGGGNNGTLANFALAGGASNWVTPGGVITGSSCGTFITPDIDVQGGSPLTSIPSGSMMPNIADGTDFGSTAVAGGTASHTFTIANTGTAELTLTGTPKVAISGTNLADFMVIAQPSSPVAASGTATFTITFDPSGLGLRTATVTIGNDDCDENPSSFAVQGMGGNGSPMITAGVPVTRQQGSAGGMAAIATVSDDLTLAGNITVVPTSLPTGISITGIVNSNGTVMAMVTAGCDATLGDNIVVLTATDANGGMVTANFIVTVTANAAPTLSYANQTALAGGSLSVNPAAATDNGNITSFALQNAGGYTGTISINPATGEVTLSNIKPTGDSTITIRATDNCGLASDASFLLTVSCQTITVGPASIVSGNPGVPYNQQFTQSGGVGAVTFSTASTLPTGINLSSNGLLSGTTTQTGSFPITIKVTDSNGCMGTASYTLAIGCPTITVTAPTANTGAAGVTFSQSFAQSGGTAGTTFSAGGPLPTGLTLSTGGLLSGTPTQTGTFPITVTATSSGGCTGMVNYILTINCPTISLSSLAGGTAGAAYSQTLTASPNGGNYSFALTAGSLPPGLSLAVNGALTGMPTQAGTFTFTVTATGFGNCTGAKAYSLVIACPAIMLSPASLPGASVNTSYSQTVSAAPSGAAYSFSVTSGGMPNGLTLNPSTGAITGSPIQTGTSNFRITAKGWGDCIGFRDYTLTVGCPGVSVTPANLPGGTTGTAYNQTVSAMPAGMYSFSVTSGALPPGLTLNAATGTITGTPSQAGSFPFTVTASVSNCFGTRSFTVTIACPAITLASLGGATAGVSFSGSVAASPSGAYTYSLQSGNLPSGFTLNPSTGVVTGLTAVPGTYSFTIKAQILNGCSGSQQYSLTVSCPSITLSALATPSLNSPYNQSVTASPLSNYSFAITVGVLPAGLSLNAASGFISGTPIVAGTFNFTIRATTFGSCTGVREYSFVIGGGGCPAITLPASVPSGSVGQLYSSSVVASPVGLYNYAVTAGSLPPGITLNSFLGMLFGYPTAAGSYGFTVRATGANNCTHSQAYTVNIGLGLMPESLPQAAVGQAYRQALASPGAQGEARFAVVAGALPSEMNLSRDGLLTGTPQQPGTHAFTVQVSDSAGFSGNRDYLLVLPPIFPPPSDPLAMTAAIDGCAVGGGTANATMTVRNFGGVSAPVNFEAPLPAGARALPDSCAANLGGCAATPQQVAWNGNLSPNQTVTITFRIQFDDNLSTQTCITASAKVVNVFGAPAAASACAVNCTVVGPGARLAAASPASDVKAGSVLIYNIFTSATDPARQNTRLSITNTDPARQAFVHLFFVDGASCSVADSFLCLTPNQTTSFLASDLDPGTTGYVVAVATDAAGCPVNFNFLIGDEYVKFQSGHAANLGAEAITAIAGGLPFCNTNSSTALLSFDGVSYNVLPHALAGDNIPSRADGNDTLLVLNRIGGNLGIGAATLGSLFGLFYDDAETSLSFTFTPGTCQFRSSISNNFPRLAPRFEQFVPAGRSGWFKVWMPGLVAPGLSGMTGAVINFNANAGASASAFNQGRNLHALTNTETASYIIPIFPPSC